MTATSTQVFYWETMPPEIGVNILTHLSPRHFQNFCLTCRHFYQIYTTSFQELFKSHFSTNQPRSGETYVQAYQREYSFPLCEFRTKWKDVRIIRLPFQVNCVKYHNRRLYIGGRGELGILDLNTYKWITPLTNLTGVMCDQLVVNEVGGVTNVFATAANTLLHVQSDSPDKVGTTRSHSFQSPCSVVALGFTGHTLTALQGDGVLSCVEVGEEGQLTWQKVHTSFENYIHSGDEELSAENCIISNGRLIIVEFDSCVNVFNAVSGEFVEKFNQCIPGDDFHTFADGDKLITIIDPEDLFNFKISYVDMVTKKLFTRESNKADQVHFHLLSKMILVYYMEGKGRLVSLTSLPLQNSYSIQIKECDPQ